MSTCGKCFDGWVFTPSGAKRCECTRIPTGNIDALKALGSAVCECGKSKDVLKPFCGACYRALPNPSKRELNAHISRYQVAFHRCVVALQFKRAEMADAKSAAANDKGPDAI